MSSSKKPVSEHIRLLHARLQRVEKSLGELAGDVSSAAVDDEILRRLTSLEERLGSNGAAGAVNGTTEGALGEFPFDKEVLSQVVDLETRLQQVESENQRLNELCRSLRDDNQAISNLYIAKHRLHASFDAGEVLRIVSEILVELVGARAFSIFFLDRRKNILKRIVGRGPAEVLGESEVELGDDVLALAARDGKAFYANGEDGASTPLAVMPLSSNDRTMGVIVVHRLLQHKSGLTPIDHQLLELVAEHAPGALLSAYLHGKKRA